MASVAQVLLNSVLAQGMTAYRALIRRGFRDEWLRDGEMREIWGYMAQYVSLYRTLPTPTIMRARFPHFHYLPDAAVVQENVSALSSILREGYTRIQLDDAIAQAAKLNAADPIEATIWLSDRLRLLQKHAVDVEMLHVLSMESVSEVEDDLMGLTEDALMLPYAWPSLQEETNGMQAGELILLYGRPKSMKSFLALYLACHAYIHSGARVLIISREMPKKQCRSRIIAILAEIAYGPWRKKRLHEHEKQSVIALLHSLVAMEKQTTGFSGLSPCIVVVDGQSQRYGGMDLAQAMIDTVQPDIVLDDSIYLAATDLSKKSGAGADGMDWKTQAVVTQRAKLMAKANNVIYMATTQANRGQNNVAGGGRAKKGKEEEEEDRREREKAKAIVADLKDLQTLAFADAYAQNCDLAIRTVLIEDHGMILLGFPGFREGKLGLLPIHGVPCSNFREMDRNDLSSKGIHEELLSAIYEQDNRTSIQTPSTINGAHPDRDPELKAIMTRGRT